jgi:hypothetical protein
MLPTYEAVLDGDHVEWRGEPPKLGTARRVHITVLDAEPENVGSGGLSDGKAMAAALDAIADRGTLDGIDSLEWQREVRKDRPLPGREHEV